MDTLTDSATIDAPRRRFLRGAAGRRLLRNPTVVIGAAILAVILLLGLAAPWLGTVDPAAINPAVRNKLPGSEETVRTADGGTTTIVHRMGTDTLGRDVYSRALYGARASLLVGVAVAAISVAIGLGIGLLAGYVRWLDGPVMRLMDGLMAIPAILLAIALVSLVVGGRRRGDRRHRHSRDSARRAPGALGRAVDARGAVRRGGDLGRHADAAADHPPHPAQHAAAADRAGHLHRAPRRS